MNTPVKTDWSDTRGYPIAPGSQRALVLEQGWWAEVPEEAARMDLAAAAYLQSYTIPPGMTADVALRIRLRHAIEAYLSATEGWLVSSYQRVPGGSFVYRNMVTHTWTARRPNMSLICENVATPDEAKATAESVGMVRAEGIEPPTA